MKEETFRDSIATVDKQGKRIWIFPKMPQGKFYNARAWVAIGLIGSLVGIPFIKVGGEPFLLFNIFERKFILFGYPFFPQDFYLLGIATLIFFVFIILFTIVFGRVWCGWACPQTIFMEMVFRKIEYWIEGDASRQKALKNAPWTRDKIVKKASKHLLFLLVSLLIAHLLMAYLIGVEEVKELITQSPANHWTAFISLVSFTGVFYLVFARLREQACTVICPYGRLQSVLLTKESIVVAYDFVRGEPRGKLKKQTPKKVDPPTIEVPEGHENCSGTCVGCVFKDKQEHKGTVEDAKLPLRPLTLEDLMPPQGDCVDCKLCVQVCPTGIDIRNGTQLECVNCTACIDACDSVMTKIGKPTGLIRFDSHNGITKKEKLKVTSRIVAYSVVLIALLVLQGFLLLSRSEIQATVLRVPGMLYQEQPNNRVSNLYNVQFTNKTTKELPVTLKLEDEIAGEIRLVGNQVMLPPSSSVSAVIFIELSRKDIIRSKTSLLIGVYSGERRIETVKTTFLGPVGG